MHRDPSPGPAAPGAKDPCAAAEAPPSHQAWIGMVSAVETEAAEHRTRLLQAKKPLQPRQSKSEGVGRGEAPCAALPDQHARLRSYRS